MGIRVCKDTIWDWVQEAVQSAIDTLDDQLDSLTQAKPVAVESMDSSIEQLPLLIGADGVMAPFRREKGSPKGATLCREVKVALVARIRPRCTKRRNDSEQTETSVGPNEISRMSWNH